MTHVKWEQAVGELSQFVRENGHAHVPTSHMTESGFQLGVWASNQRSQFRMGSLGPEKSRVLEDLGFAWKQHEAKWNLAFERLKTFIEKHGHCYLRQNHREADGFPLGQWTYTVRNQYSREALAPERVERLNAIGFIWNTRESRIAAGIDAAPVETMHRREKGNRDTRNAEILRRYKAGETLELIGKDYGITRERVRQIVSKLGASREEHQQTKLDLKISKQREAEAQFVAEWESDARKLALEGKTLKEVVDTLQERKPDLDTPLAFKALRNTDILFHRSRDGYSIISAGSILTGVWYLRGLTLGLAPDPEWRDCLDPETVDEVSEHLIEMGVTFRKIDEVFGVASASMKHGQSNPESSYSIVQYRAARDKALAEFGVSGGQGTNHWPPTNQTAMTRIGENNKWNEVLVHMGLAKNPRAPFRPHLEEQDITFGSRKFSDADYEDAIASFLIWAMDLKLRPVMGRYDEWHELETQAGRERPKSSSVLKQKGNWSTVVQSMLQPA